MNIRLSEKDKIQVRMSTDIYRIMQRILERENRIDKEKEHLWIVGLNHLGVILYIELVSLGTASKTLVEPMNVFRVAILKGASQILIVHNHPSGNLEPSEADKNITDQLIQCGNILNITVPDHLIITTKNYYSFCDRGLMDELQGSQKYVPTYQLIEKVKRQERKIRKELVKENEEKLRVKEQELEEYKNTTIKKLLQRQLQLEEIAAIMDIPVEEIQQFIKG